MIANTMCGLDVTTRCTWSCEMCFYRREPSFHSNIDVPLSDLKAQVLRGKAGGLNHVVAIGKGEPSLYPQMEELLDWCHSIGMGTSMISNGSTGLDRFKRFFDIGMDHIILSSHALDDRLEQIVHAKNAFERQDELKKWLYQNKLPFCTNVTMQRLNYMQLPELMEHECSRGVYHAALLNVLPHYSWSSHVTDIAVDPRELARYVEAAADVLLDRRTRFTIRYVPFCALRPKYWPFIMNARYVFFSALEWCYPLQCRDVDALWRSSVECGESVAIRGDPCNRCVAQQYCGSWNRTYAVAFPGCVHAITEVPSEYHDGWGKVEYLWDKNPANTMTANFRS